VGGSIGGRWTGGGWGGEWCIYNPVREKEHCGLCAAWLMLGFMPKATVCKAGVATSVPSWTSHRRPTAFTALGAQGVAPGGNGARLAQCGLRAQLRVAIRGRLVILRSRNGDEAAGCDLEGAIQGGVGDLANVS
jgi:hypothetical protein